MQLQLHIHTMPKYSGHKLDEHGDMRKDWLTLMDVMRGVLADQRQGMTALCSTCSARASMRGRQSSPLLRTRLPRAPAALALVLSSSSRSNATNGPMLARRASYKLLL